MDEVFKDDEGRYVIISHGERIIGSVYAPNKFEPPFFSKLIAAVSSIMSPLTIIGGDFHCVQDASIDQSTPKPFISNKTARLKELCVDLNLFDIRRVTNPGVKDYTFCSHPHQSLARIDYFLASREIQS